MAFRSADQEADPFLARFELGAVLGRGTYGQVRVCRERGTGLEYACKEMPGPSPGQASSTWAAIHREIAVMELLRQGEAHPGVVRLREAHVPSEKEQGPGQARLVMDLCRGGDLFHLLKSNGRMPEAGAKALFRQLASAVAFCHSRSVIHRDIKPENILFDRPAAACLYSPCSTKAALVHARLADFGLAAVVDPGDSTSGFSGSRYYVAPEMLRGESYGSEVDVWSLGVVLCAVLTARVPFHGKDRSDRAGLRRAILEAPLDLASKEWDGVSAEARDLVRWMLERNPKLRPQARELIRHPWCTETPSAAQMGRPAAAKSQPKPRIPLSPGKWHFRHFRIASSPMSEDAGDLLAKSSSGRSHLNSMCTVRGGTKEFQGQSISVGTGSLAGPYRRLRSQEGESKGAFWEATRARIPVRTAHRRTAATQAAHRGSCAERVITASPQCLVQADGMCGCQGYVHLRSECKGLGKPPPPAAAQVGA